MDFNRIVQMVINQLVRRAVSGGINVAIKQASHLTGPASPADPEHARTAALVQKRARQAAKLTRKF